MRKKLTLLFTLLCVSLMGWADTEYCGYEIIGTTHGHKMSITYQSLGGNQYTLIMTSTDDIVSYNAGSNFYTEVNGVGGTNVSANLTKTGNTLTFTTTSNPKPNVYVGDFYVNYSDGEEHYNIPTDEDWTATCGASCDDSQKPSVTDVNVGDIAYNSAVLTITANDNIGVTRYVVKNGDVQLAQGASNVITLTGLTPSTAYDNIKVFAYDACNNESDAFSVTSFNTEALTYCRFATGHLGQANFGDQFGRILLTIKKVNETTIAVKVEPNNNGTRGIKYMNIIVNGTSHEFGNNDGSGEDLTGFYEISGLASLDFTFNLFFYCNTPNWTTNQFNVTEAELCEETTELSVGSEYCTYYGDETKTGSRYATLTWETNEDGDVVITIGDGPGETNTAFRSNGLGNDLSGFTVLSGAGFATSEPASDYFNRVYGGAGTKTYILQKKGGVTLPSPAKIHFQGKAFEWKCTEEGNAYTNPTFEYTYGKICSQLDAPTNVAIDGTNYITFSAVAGADSYMAYVSLGGVEKYSQTVASGDELTFVPLVSGDYTVNVIASGAGKVDSDPSADYVWHLEAAPIVLGNSEYCEKNMSSGNTEAAFTWETDGSGNIVITISEVLDGANDPAHFRANAFKDGLKVGTSKEDLSNYFNIPATIDNADHSQKTLTYTLKDPANAPAPGEKIYYNGVVEYRTSENTDAWPTLQFEYTYGTVCSGKSVSASVNNNTMGSAVVKVGDDEVTSVEENTAVTFIATSADPALYRFVNWTKGGVEVSTSATYVATITETTNLVANFDYIRETYCHYELLSNESAVQGKKLYMTVGAIGGGDYRIMYEGSVEAPFTGLQDANYVINQVTAKTDVDGQPKTGQDVPFTKTNGRWNFSAEGYGKAWIEFSLAEGKTIDDIYVWANAIYFNTASGVLGYADNNDRLGLFGMNAAKRHNIDWEATCTDSEAPVFSKAEAEVLNATDVRLKILATDNWEGLLTYTIARADADPIISNHASGEEFTQDIESLTTGTEYTFTVTVSDGVNNTNQNIVVTPVADETKPVMGAASLASKTWNSAIINVAATDNKGVTAYQVVNEDPAINVELVAEEGKITIEGLAANTDYNFTIKAKDAAGNISDNSANVSFKTNAHLLAPTAAAPDPTWPAAQVKALYSLTYGADYNHQDWGGGTNYTQDEYGKKYVTTSAPQGYFGADGFSLNCLMMEKLHYDIWIADDATIRIVPIWGGAEQGITVNLTGQQWNSIDINLSEYTGITNWGNIYQMKIDQAYSLTFWVGNAYFYRTEPIVDNAAPTDVTANVAEEGFNSVKITVQATDENGAVNFSIRNGGVEVATGAASSEEPTTITVNGLAAGKVYNLDVIASDEAGNEAAPVAVVATTKAFPVPAPAPVVTGRLVVPVFSDAVAGAPAEIHSGGWGESTVPQWLQLTSSDKVFYGQNFNYAGWHSFGNIDASNMQYLHVDIYSAELTKISVTPISPAVGTEQNHEGEAEINLTPEAWTSVDIALSAYDGNDIDWSKVFQFKFFNPSAAGKDFFVDNVYFWSYGVATNAQVGSDETTGGWATFAAPVKLAVPEGIKAYKAAYQKTETEEILNLTEIHVIPAGAGVILHGAASTEYMLALTNDEADDVSDNQLVGCVTRTDVSAVRASNDIFCMRYSELYTMTGFFLYTGQYVPAGRAYLPLPIEPNAPAGAPRKVRFVFNQEQVATGIENAGATSVETVKFIENGQLFIRRGEAVYTIQGVRVK